MRIENWSIVYVSHNPYLPPECQTQCLQGNVYGHPDHFDGKRVTTSAAIGRKDNCLITLAGSEYELGEPDPEYETLFPNAKQRALESAAKMSIIPRR